MTKQTAKDWILSQRLQNYGYDWKDFRKMSSSKTKLKSQIRNMSDADIRRNLAKAGILGRGRRMNKVTTRSGKKVWEYTTGQSFNEELLNIMQLGSGKNKSWWETQKIW